MAKGKKTCRILKEIRRQIAEANEIEYVVEECQYKGDCMGTCPKCEAEVRYLEDQLQRRQLLGKAVMVAGLSLGVIPAMAQNAQVADSVVAQSSMCVLDTNLIVLGDQAMKGKYRIQGKVLYSDQTSIIGATILYNKERQLCKVSDVNGEFAFCVDDLPVKAKVSYLGLLPFEFEVTEENYNKFFQITLADDNDILSDFSMCGVVVINKKTRARLRKERKAARKEEKKRRKNE